MSSIKEGFELPKASWNFNGEKLAEEVFKWLSKWHQWIQHIQKPLAGILRHLNQPNDEEVRPPPFFSFKLCWNWLYKTHLCVHQPSTHAL
jgi:hypothetical protein